MADLVSGPVDWFTWRNPDNRVQLQEPKCTSATPLYLPARFAGYADGCAGWRLPVVGGRTICSTRGGCREPSFPRVQPVEVPAPPGDAIIRSQQPVPFQGGTHDDMVSRAGVKAGQGVGADANPPVDGDIRGSLLKQSDERMRVQQAHGFSTLSGLVSACHSTSTGRMMSPTIFIRPRPAPNSDREVLGKARGGKSASRVW